MHIRYWRESQKKRPPGRHRWVDNIVTCKSNSWSGFGLDIVFIVHLYKKFISTSNYNSLNELHTPNITVPMAHIKLCLHSLTFNWLLTNCHWLFSSDSHRECTWCPNCLPYNSSAWPTQATPFLCCMCIRCHGNVFTEPLPSRGCLFLLIKNLLPSNGRRSAVCFMAVA
jgi:hypothetical protein